MKLHRTNEEFEFTGLHQKTINGKKIDYLTRAIEYRVADDTGKFIGTMCSFEYIKQGNGCSENRPILFAYNGGPGSSSLWIHTGMLGTKIVSMDDCLNPPTTPPFDIEDNQNCIIDICDIVIIDPVGTGYGIINDRDAFKTLSSVTGDANCIAEFICTWLSDNNRMDSPKYLLGESYGTIRSCVVASALMGGPSLPGAVSRGISLDGIIFMGSAITFDPATEYFFEEKQIPQCVLELPTIAATNCFYKKNKNCFEGVKDAYAFISEYYLKALYLGDRLSMEEQNSTAKRLAELTGLAVSEIKKNRLEPRLKDYVKDRLSDEELCMGVYDTRFSMKRDSFYRSADPVADDCAMGKYMPSFRGAFEIISKEELGITLKRTYNIIDFNINGQWDYSLSCTPFEHLQHTIRRNRNMRIMFANGIFDACCTIGQASYAAAKLDAEEGQVIVKEYPSGHMPYLDDVSAKMLLDDIRSFIG